MEKRSRSNSKAAVIRCKWQYRRDSLRCISNGKIANADKFFRGRYCLGEEEFAVKICIRKNPENLSERSAVGKSIAGKKKGRFYYNQKINCMRAEGFAEYNGNRYEFHPEKHFGTLDWGRGVWTYDNTWYWGSGNCDVDGHAFGFNIGYGFGNTKAASENVIFYDGVAHKIDDVTFVIPEDDYCKPWKFTSSDGRCEMDFMPLLDRSACLDYKLIVSDQHQVFGRMSGTTVLDDGTKVEIKDVLCFSEKVHNRY